MDIRSRDALLKRGSCTAWDAVSDTCIPAYTQNLLQDRTTFTTGWCTIQDRHPVNATISLGLASPNTPQWNNFTANKAGNILHSHMTKHPYRIVHPGKFTYQSGSLRPSTLDYFITDYCTDCTCEITDDFDTPHRPVVLTATKTTGPQCLKVDSHYPSSRRQAGGRPTSATEKYASVSPSR